MNTTPPKHIVAAGGLVRHPDGRVLLILGSKHGWEFPGGQVEEGESLTDALIREIQEETGVTASVRSLVGVYTNVESHIVMFGFLCDWVSGEPQAGPEALAATWADPEKAVGWVAHPAIRARLEDMVRFSGRIVYRSYSVDASAPGTPQYTVHEERYI